MALTLHDLLEGRHQLIIPAVLLVYLFVHVSSQISNRCNIVINFVKFACNQEDCNLVQNHSLRVHQLQFKGFFCHLLANCEVVLINYLDRDMDCLTCLSKLDTHFVHSIYDSFATLKGKMADVPSHQKLDTQHLK